MDMDMDNPSSSPNHNYWPSPKKKLTNKKRREICEYFVNNPGSRQQDVAAKFGIELSIVSKILKHKNKWMRIATRERNLIQKPSSSDVGVLLEKRSPILPSVKRCVEEYRRKNTIMSDEIIRKKAGEIAQTSGCSSDEVKELEGVIEDYLRASRNLQLLRQTGRRRNPQKKTVHDVNRSPAVDGDRIENYAEESGSQILSANEADTKFATPEHVLAALNEIFLKEPLGFNDGPCPLRDLLISFINRDLDFGAIYARLRSNWPKADATLKDDDGKSAREEEISSRVLGIEHLVDSDAQIRWSSVEHRSIVSPESIQPRRLWDLCANRVIPYHYSAHEFCAISHSWTADMRTLDTPINGFEWPVPVPNGVNLESVRKELVDLGEEYVWIDILCLRQRALDSSKEEMRKLEWEVDLPTIGFIFDRHAERVIRYMNGLGRTFRNSGWDDPRHWLNRSWTLQEAKIGSIISGVPDPRTVPDLQARLRIIDNIEVLHATGEILQRFAKTIDIVRRRHATNPVDKVFGVAMIFCRERLPLYDAELNLEEAWSICIEHLPSTLLGTFLFTAHIPGDEGVRWRPSWSQFMKVQDASGLFSIHTYTFDRFDALSVRPDGMAVYKGPIIEAHFSPSHAECAEHCMTVQGKKDLVTVPTKLHPHYDLPEGDYTFVGDEEMIKWVVCNKTTDNLRLQKVTVLELACKLGRDVEVPIRLCWFT
ncbi:hypothetical protein SCHPADRAFT_937589 [Schizopora paradoxa]|uniref:Uncharacterized protein n=1 Tax=Schizopora paradoxa TaxID=27342 RepID=A0A0H2S4W7_9AGAM|nr:hypothetical protein SCHPADRAFT_937589 [Schizopora paradoxa]